MPQTAGCPDPRCVCGLVIFLSHLLFFFLFNPAPLNVWVTHPDVTQWRFNWVAGCSSLPSLIFGDVGGFEDVCKLERWFPASPRARRWSTGIREPPQTHVPPPPPHHQNSRSLGEDSHVSAWGVLGFEVPDASPEEDAPMGVTAGIADNGRVTGGVAGVTRARGRTW